MLSESHSSFHIELQPTFFVKTDVQLFCRGNNGCWRWGGPSARYNPPLPWALRQVWEHRAKFFVHPNLNILREKNRLTRSEFWRPFFSNPGLSTQWSRVQCSGSGRTSSKLPGVERLADSLAFSFYQMTLCWFFVLSNDSFLLMIFFPATCVVSPPVPESYIHRGLWCFWHDLQVKSIIQIQIINITCYLDLIRFEANQQFLRDWMVEAEMLGLLRLVLLCLPCKTRFNPKIEVLMLWS